VKRAPCVAAILKRAAPSGCTALARTRRLTAGRPESSRSCRRPRPYSDSSCRRPSMTTFSARVVRWRCFSPIERPGGLLRGTHRTWPATFGNESGGRSADPPRNTTGALPARRSIGLATGLSHCRQSWRLASTRKGNARVARPGGNVDEVAILPFERALATGRRPIEEHVQPHWLFDLAWEFHPD
jgi:hypothetical protein